MVFSVATSTVGAIYTIDEILDMREVTVLNTVVSRSKGILSIVTWLFRCFFDHAA